MRLSPAHSIRSYPATGELFELVFYGDHVANQPLELVRQTGNTPSGWAYTGPSIVGRAVRYHKLVELKSILTFNEVRAELDKHGDIHEGQWVSGFKAAFPKPDGKGPIGIADASWVAPDGHFNFLYIGRGGDLRFHRTSGTFGPGWRWIVGITEAPF